MKRSHGSDDSKVTFNVSHSQLAKSMKQMLDDKLFIDAKIASKSSPDQVLECHRLHLAANSKVFLRKFRKNTNPETVITIENVDVQNLKYFLQLIYSGKVDIPKEKVSEFKVTLFDLKFDKLADDQDESDDDEMENPTAKVMKMETSSEPSALLTTPKKTTPAATVKEEIDRKPVLQENSTTGHFLANVFNSSKETLIPDFSAQQLHNQSLNTSGSSSGIKTPTPSFKPTFVPPPINSPVVSKPKANVKLGLLNLFWFRFSNPGMRKDEAPKDAKHVYMCKNGSDFYISFEIEAEAKEFLKTNKGAVPVQEVSFKDLFQDDAVKLDKELSARPRIQLKIENLPGKWTLNMVLRMFKAHDVPIKKNEVNYDQYNRCIFLQVPDKCLVEKIERCFHGSVQEGHTLHVVIM